MALPIPAGQACECEGDNCAHHEGGQTCTNAATLVEPNADGQPVYYGCEACEWNNAHEPGEPGGEPRCPNCLVACDSKSEALAHCAEEAPSLPDPWWRNP